jgi:hypothetical protein
MQLATKGHKGHKKGINFGLVVERGEILVEELTGFLSETPHLSCRHPLPTQVCVGRGGHGASHCLFGCYAVPGLTDQVSAFSLTHGRNHSAGSGALAGYFLPALRRSPLTDPLSGYARGSLLVPEENSCAIAFLPAKWMRLSSPIAKRRG